MEASAPSTSDYHAILASDLFDSNWYLSSNKDVAMSGSDPAMHYLVLGGMEGRPASFRFHSAAYYADNPDVARAGVNPLLHYLIGGKAEGRKPTTVVAFSAQFGRHYNADVARLAALVARSRLYDPHWFRATYPDLVATGRDPIAHILAPAKGRPVNPGPGFDASAYLDAHRDVAEAGIDPFLHYVQWGEAEGRAIAPVVPHNAGTGRRSAREDREALAASPLFQPEWYMKAYGARIPAGMDAASHFLAFGMTGDFHPGPGFDAREYLRTHPEVVAANANPLLHSISTGQTDQRVSSPVAPLSDRAQRMLDDLFVGRDEAPSRSISRFHAVSISVIDDLWNDTRRGNRDHVVASRTAIIDSLSRMAARRDSAPLSLLIPVLVPADLLFTSALARLEDISPARLSVRLLFATASVLQASRALLEAMTPYLETGVEGEPDALPDQPVLVLPRRASANPHAASDIRSFLAGRQPSIELRWPTDRGEGDAVLCRSPRFDAFPDDLRPHPSKPTGLKGATETADLSKSSAPTAHIDDGRVRIAWAVPNAPSRGLVQAIARAPGLGREVILHKRETPLHNGALQVAAELPVELVGNRPITLDITVESAAAPVTGRCSLPIAPTSIRPSMVTCYLNRGGAGNPVVKAFASAIGARLAFAEDAGDTVPGVPVVWGVLRGSDTVIRRAQQNAQYWFYIDHAYFARGHLQNYRITRNRYEAGPIRECPPDRLSELGIAPRPWKKQGSIILVCPPTAYFMVAHGCETWLEDTVAVLRASTDREIVVREKPREGMVAEPLEAVLDRTHALVTHSSNVAIEAVVAGVPVFVSPTSAAAPVGRTELTEIERPIYPDREMWLRHLAYSQYAFSEIHDGTAWRLLMEIEERNVIKAVA